MTAPTSTGAPARFPMLAGVSTLMSAALAVISAVVVATVVDTAIAAIARGAGVPSGFAPLHFATYTSLTVIGVLAGTAVWTLVRSRSQNAATLLRRLVPIVVVVSFVPDILVGAAKSQPHTTWGGIGALMVMHVVVAAAAVVALVVLLPVHDRAVEPTD